MSIHIGATIRLRFTFADRDGVPYSPKDGDSEVTVRAPSDALDAGTSYVIDSTDSANVFEVVSAGVYDLPIVITEGGRWHWRCSGVDADDEDRVDVSEGAFEVLFSRVISQPAVSS